MKSRTVSQHRDLQVLEALTEDHGMTQRALAGRLDIAVGLANLYVKRLIQKGFIKCVNVRPNRIRYLLTPKGISEKARLTYEFMDYSLRLYRQARERLVEALPPPGASPRVCIYIHGRREAAELTYLTLREQGIEPVAIFASDRESAFLGLEVRPVAEHDRFDFDLMVVATLEPTDRIIALLTASGVPASKALLLRPSSPSPSPIRGRSRGTQVIA